MQRSALATAAAAMLAIVPFSVSFAQSLEERIQLCNSCHGESGIPQEKTIPVIWGQHQGYLYLQLRDFRNGDRKNELMQPALDGTERSDLMALAEYFSQKPWPNLRQKAASEAVAAKAQRANVAVGCTGCHLGEYQGAGAQPRLAGQSREYMAQTMLDFRTGARTNNPGMSDLMKATSEEDIAAMAEYLAGL